MHDTSVMFNKKVASFTSNTALFFGVGIFIGLTAIFGLNAITNSNNPITTLLQENPQSVSASGQVIGSNSTEFGSMESNTNREWFLKGDQFTAEQKVLEFSVALTENQLKLLNDDSENSITYAINESPTRETLPTTLKAESSHKAIINTADFDPGVYTIQAFATVDGKEWTSSVHTFHVSYPVYVAWTIDWEGYDVKDEYLADMASIANDHQMPLTHFFNPRIFTNSKIPDGRASYLTQWVLDRKNTKGDVIGLHLHMFPDMVEAAGVAPIKDPVTWGSTLDDGYDILAANYGYDEMKTILEWSKNTFEANQLGTPTLFRAGGWYADMEVLQAVNDTGFNVDSSGRTAYQFGEKAVEGYWNLDATTQPYQPNIYDQNSKVGPTLDIWEFPNNGADSWKYSSQEMIQRFNQNKPNIVADQNTVITYLSHPEWFTTDSPKMEALLEYIDQYSFDSDTGPVLYVTLEETYNIWE